MPTNDSATALARPLRGSDRSEAALVAKYLEQDGLAVLRGRIPPDVVDAALRCLHLDLVRRGVSAAQIAAYHETKCWFPHLRWEPEILALQEHVPAGLREGVPCEPQILLHLPDEATEWPLEAHIDQPPPWANGRPYRSIFGVAMSRSALADGGLVVWPFGGREPQAVELEAGDVVAMHPQLPHSGGLNRGGSIRYLVYFRFLGAEAPPRRY